MSQIVKEHYKQQDMILFEKLEELIGSAEIEIQRAVTMVELKTDSEEAFKDLVSYTNKMTEIAESIETEDLRFIALETISLFTSEFKETVKQINIILK